MMQSKQKEIINDDDHVLNMWTPLKLDITENYQYVPKSIIFNILSTLLYIIAYPILVAYNVIMYGFTVEGKENIKKIKGGKITISNHVHPMDCTMNAIINAPHKMYFPTLKSNFEIPVIRHIIKLLHAIPIPNTLDRKKDFFKCIDDLLISGKTVHLYPETAMWPYCKRLRNFKDGAFKFSINNKVPIVPIIYIFRKPENIYSLFKRKECITARILEPVYCKDNETIKDFKNRVHDIMEGELKKSYISNEKKEYI